MVCRNDINNEYFDWMCNLVCGDRYSKYISYRRLLEFLHNIEFTYSILKDENRAEDGIDLRYRFLYRTNKHSLEHEIQSGPCSVLEMMIALSIRCEESIMDDPLKGNRTGKWFWGMIRSLGLSSMTDDRFDSEYVYDVIRTFLEREYEPDGRGGLFTVKHCKHDLRTVEIWYQMCWYLDSIA